MSMVYIPDELIFKIRESGQDKTKFIRDAIEKKLERYGPQTMECGV